MRPKAEIFSLWTVAKHQLYLWKALSRKFTLDWCYPFTDHRIHIFRQLIMRAMAWNKTRNLIKLECIILFYQCPWRTGKKMKWEIFRINFLVTRIQFLDCNSCTMLFKHSQFRLWVRDWIFHPLVVKKLV